MNIDTTIFKAYDIRGIYPEQLNEDLAYNIGRAYADFLKKDLGTRPITVAIGADMRLSSPSLKGKVVQGLLDAGINVDDIGLVSTPTFYFGVANYNYDGGLQVSASHNPKEWNGIKIVKRGGAPVSGNSGIYEMRDMILNDSLLPLVEYRGALKTREGVLEAEVADALSQVDIQSIKPFKVVIDAANAMGALDCEALFAKLPCEVVKMNFELDGTFPAHEADPFKPENIRFLESRVLHEKADLGIAPDGDGDRIFFVDETGAAIHPAILRGLMAQIELRENPSVTVAYDIRPGRITQDMIDEFGGKAIVTPVGHSLIKEIMIANDATFGGESSGHFFFKRPYGTFEMPMLLILKLLKYISQQGKPLSEVIAPYIKYAHSGEINTKVGSKDQVQAKLAEIKEKYFDGKINLLDGVTVEYDDVWFNLRGSNTEPVIRLTVEARTQELMEQKRDELLELIRG